jgi:hypothetical protein
VADVGAALGCDDGVLVQVRQIAGSALARIPGPVGFLPRSATNKGCRRRSAAPVVSSGCEARSLADKGAERCKIRDETRDRSPPRSTRASGNCSGP